MYYFCTRRRCFSAQILESLHSNRGIVKRLVLWKTSTTACPFWCLKKCFCFDLKLVKLFSLLRIGGIENDSTLWGQHFIQPAILQTAALRTSLNQIGSDTRGSSSPVTKSFIPKTASCETESYSSCLGCAIAEGKFEWINSKSELFWPQKANVPYPMLRFR